jgi:HD superfamily phosphohydrolase
MSDQVGLEALWEKLRSCGPIVRRVLDHLAPKLIQVDVISEADIDKRFNDPIWKTITLRPTEVRLLDMSLMQRLRGVRQLGLAHLVYPTAQHSRFEHSLGAVHAATRILDTVAPQTDLRFRRAVRIASLLHDCGHTSFSHVGERALVSVPSLAQSLGKAKEVLNAHFDDPVRAEIQTLLERRQRQHTVRSLPSKGPPAAEIIASLLILSPAMISAGSALQLSHSDLLRSASLVLGRPYELSYGSSTAGSKAYADYVKSVVSSDLDADKLDYVARDAYFAGIPIAADVERLMSQLTIVEYSIAGNKSMGRCEVMAILPTGVASVEMFIMTRAYLFNRLYQHPKVRLAEALLHRRLHAAVEARLRNETLAEQGIDAVLDLLYGLNGDDACLETLDLELSSASRLSEIWRKPRRVLALSPRLVHGYDRENGHPSSLLTATWSPAATQIQQNPAIYEKAIAGILGIDPSNVIVDWQREANIKENPAVFVADPFRHNRLVPLGEAFDIGQLAAAYEDVKSVAWVYANHGDTARAAAAAAIAAANLFGLVPTNEAVTQAKVDPARFTSALKTLPTAQLDIFAAQQILGVTSERLIVPHVMARAVINLPAEDTILLSVRLADMFNNSRMRAVQFYSVAAALTVAGLLIDYIEATANSGPRHDLEINEKVFRQQVMEWLGHRLANQNDIRLDRERQMPAGRVDLEVPTSRAHKRIVPVELKAEDGRFETVIQRNRQQAFQYLTNIPYEHVGVLFCRFRAHDERRQSNLVHVEFAESGDPPTAIICVGQHVPPASASASKRSAGSPRRKSGRSNGRK